MLDKNSIPLGFFLGLTVPLVGYFVFLGIYEGLETLGWVSSSGFRPMFRERTCAIIALALNIFLLNSYQKKYLYNSVRGIVSATSIYVIVWLVLFSKYVF